jgi:hypothetical protein
LRRSAIPATLQWHHGLSRLSLGSGFIELRLLTRHLFTSYAVHQGYSHSHE